MKPVSSCRLRRAVLPSPAGRGIGAEGPALVQSSLLRRLHLRVDWLSPDWSSVSSGCRRTSHFSLLAQREVTKRNGTRTCRPHDEAVRVRKHWPGWVEGASVHLQPNPRDPSRIPQAAGPSSTCRQERAGESKAPRSAMRCAAVDLCPVLGRRTPEPTRAVVQLHRTTDPSGCAFFGLRFFAQTKKGNSRAGRREKRFAILAVAIEKVRRGSRVIRLSRLAKTARLLEATQRSAPHLRALSRRDRGEKLRAAAQKRVARG